MHREIVFAILLQKRPIDIELWKIISRDKTSAKILEKRRHVLVVEPRFSRSRLTHEIPSFLTVFF